MTLFLLAIAALLAVLVLWGVAWRNRPILAFGICLGTLTVFLLAPIVRPSGIQHIPIWLPALPFALVAVGLLYFGILAWWWGKSG